MAERPDLLDLCRATLSRAKGGEQAEAYAGWTKRTDVKARRGEVDELTAAETRGVGVRVIRRGRLGYAWLRVREFLWTIVAFHVSKLIGYVPPQARFSMNTCEVE